MAANKNWRLINLPLSDYQQVLKLQEDILGQTIAGKRDNTLILVEHKPVFTCGNHSNPANLKVSRPFLESHNIKLVQTRRGGDITYHGPGQIIAYPIISLKKNNLSVPSYINLLEEVMLQTTNAFGIETQRSIKNRGVWYGTRKMGSVGIALKRWVSYHGLALNTNMEMTPFGWINPCGLKNSFVTSMHAETQQDIRVTEVKKTMISAFENIFAI